MATRLLLRTVAPWLLLLQSGCGQVRNTAPQTVAATPRVVAPAAKPAVGGGFRCNLLLGVAVTSEWFDAGFERIVDDQRWEAITKPHTSLEQWGDPNNSVWSLGPTSACTEGASAPDRVLFTAMNWEYTSESEWEAGLVDVVRAIQTRFPSVKQIVLLSMIRAPENVSCGNAMSVVAPFVDEAIATVAARSPEQVRVGPKLEAPSCEVFKNGGPHFTDAGRQLMAQRIAEYFAHQP